MFSRRSETTLPSSSAYRTVTLPQNCQRPDVHDTSHMTRLGSTFRHRWRCTRRRAVLPKRLAIARRTNALPSLSVIAGTTGAAGAGAGVGAGAGAAAIGAGGGQRSAPAAAARHALTRP